MGSLFGLISYDDGSSFGDSDIVNDVVPGLFCQRPSIERVENEQAPISPNRNMTPVRSPVNNTRSQSVSPYVRSSRRSSFQNLSPVNWRTGMSGHTALNSNRLYPDSVPRGEIRMMGEHKGIASIRPMYRRSINIPEPARIPNTTCR